MFRGSLSLLSSRVKQANKKCLTLEGGKNRLSRNVANYHTVPRNISEEQRFRVRKQNREVKLQNKSNRILSMKNYESWLTRVVFMML
jgi:hypothetical protein